MMRHVSEEHTTVGGIDRGSDFEEENYSSDESTGKCNYKIKI